MNHVKKYLRPYLAMIISLAILEYLWFFQVIGDFFSSEISHILSEDPNIAVATLFYIFYPVAIIVLVLSRTKNPRDNIIFGAFLGFTVYFVYDITNYVTLFEWSAKLMVVDIIWGTFVTGLVSAIGYKFLKQGEN